MSSSVLDMEEVHDVLSIMEKNLECPICLELMKEPVTTKCDHIFCRFCMLKLLNKKKRGRAECPMCKHEITKRSLQDSPRFKLLVEGLLKTIQAFELDTGHKFSCSPDKGMKAFEVCSSEQLVKDMGLIVHSTGYRTRRKRVYMDGQENLGLILQETSSNVKLKKDLFQESPRRSKRQKLSSGKQVRLKSGSESSEEDLLEKAGSLGVGETDLLQTPDQGSDLEIEACEGCERDTVDDPLSPRADAEEIILSDLAEYDFSERENESSRDVASRTEDFRTTASSLSEQNMPKNFGNAASNPLPGESNCAALQNDGECLSNKAKVPSTEVLSVTLMEKSPKSHSSGRKSKDCDLQEKEREASNQDHDCSYENESSLLHPDRSENSTPCSVSSKRARTGVQRVTEWLSKLNEEMFALPPQDDYEPEVEALSTIRSKEKRHSGDSWASDKTEIMQNLLEVENCQSSSKPPLATIEDKIFGKTYKRERKSNPLLNISVLNDGKRIDDLAVDSVKECKDVRTPVLKRRRKLDLQPEDFIRRINKNDKNTSGICKGEAIVGQVPERKGVGAAFHFEVSPDACTWKCNKSLDQPSLEDGCEYIVDRTIEQKDDPAAAVFNGCPLKCEVLDALSPGDITLVSGTVKDKVKSNRKMMGPPIHANDQTQAAQVKDLMSKRCKYQTRRVPALELVRRGERVTDHEAVDTFSVLSPNNLIDLQIDSYPSSEERRKAKGGSISLRRSRRLLLQTEETSTLITLCNGSNKEEKPDQVSAGEDLVSGKEITISVPSCSLSNVHVNLIDCNKLKSNGNHRKAELYCEKQTLNHTPTDYSALIDVKDLNTTMSEEGIHWSPSELHNELEEVNTQNSTSLLMVPPEKDQMTYPLQNSHPIKEYSNCESSSDGLPITTSMDMILCGSNDLQHTKSQSPHINNSVLPVLRKEVDDSEQETELLLKTFKGAKRRSFILQPSPLPVCTFEGPASPPCRDRTDAGQSDVKGKAPSSNYIQIGLPEDPLLCADFQKATGYSSDHAETCGNTDAAAGCSNSICNTIKDNQRIPSQYPELHTPVSEKYITHRSKKGLRRRGNLNVGSLSSLEVVESSFRNIFRDSCRSSDLHNPEVIVQGTESHTINETEPSEGTERVGKASVGKNNGLALNLPPESMPLPLEVPHQNSATVCCKLTELAKSDCSQSSAFGKEQVNPRSCSDQGHEPGLMEFPKQPAVACGSGTNNTQVSSETPDGLLSISNEARGNMNFPELNIRCASVGLTGKTCEESRFVAGNLAGSSSGSSVPGLKGSTHRHPALKLFSSESSEEEELPCFQALLFAEAFNPSCDSGGPKNSADDSSSKQQGGGLVFSSSSACELKIQEDCSREGPASPSQQSECSVNLFSSQSNASEKSVTEDPKQSSTVTANQRERALQANKNALEKLEVVCQDHEEEESEVGNEEQNGQSTDQHLGEGSEYESEASHTGDSSGLSSQGEILTTQQRAIMQNNLEKLQKEMAVLQAVLEQNETQDLAVPNRPSVPLQHNATGLPNGKVDSSEKSTSFTSKQDMEASENCELSDGSADNQLSVIPTFPCRREMEDVEYKRSPTPPPTPSRSQLTKRKTPDKVRHSMRLLKELKEAACAQDEDSQLVRVDQPEVPLEAEKSDKRSEPVGFLAEKAAGTRRSSARVLSRLYENIGMTPSRPSPSALSSENNYINSKDSLISPCITSKDRRRHSKRIERETGISTFVTPARVAAEPVMVKTPVVTNKRKISMVASGLNQSELLLVQKFSSKTKSTLSHQISDGTTHVIMKTDAELVCERTLKYFLGIAGRKWVVGYQWIVQCFKEGRILDEIDFEVRGDVINGRTHGGPRRARLSSCNLLWKDFEICCSGSFTDMTTEHLERMVTLCGGSVVKQPHLFTHDRFTAVLVVQPDACSEDTDFSAMKRKYNVTVVTREWMLDSVARYECQKFDAYLLPVS